MPGSPVLDSFALLTFLRDEPGGETVAAILEKASAREQPVHMTEVNYAEVQYIVRRKDGEAAWHVVAGELVAMPIEFHPADRPLADLAALSDRVGEHFPATSDATELIGKLGLAGSLEWDVSRLSTGYRQRLGLARALCPPLPPEILLHVEPIGSFLPGLPPFYVPGAVRVGSTATDVSSGRRSEAESARGHIAPYSAGVRYPSEL